MIANNGNKSFVLSGSVNNGGTVSNAGSGTGTATISGAIGTNVTGVTQNSSTSGLTLSGANTYTSATTVTAGTLALGANNTLSSSTAVNVGASGTFNLGGYSDTISSITSNGAVTFGTGNTLTTSGAQTYNGTLTGNGITLASTGGGAISATNAANSLTGNIGVSTTGSATIATANSLTLGTISTGAFTAQAVAGSLTLAGPVNATGNVVLQSGLDITLGGQLTSSAAGNAITLNSGRNIINNYGSNALNLTGGGRWLAYSASPDSDTKGGLTGYTKRYNRTYAGYAPGSVTETGNVWLYSVAPVLTVSTAAQNVVYGSGVAAFTPTISGFIGGDTASSALTGSATFSSAVTSSSNVGTYGVTTNLNNLANVLGYQINAANSTVTITQANLTIAADSKTKVTGVADPALTYSYSGLKNGDTASIFSGTLSRATGDSIGIYAINQGTLAATANYHVTYIPGTFTVALPVGVNYDQINAPTPQKTILQAAPTFQVPTPPKTQLVTNGVTSLYVDLTALDSIAPSAGMKSISAPNICIGSNTNQQICKTDITN